MKEWKDHVVCTFALLVALTVGCHPGKTPVTDEFSRWSDGKADGFTDLKIVGPLSYGQTSDPVSYTTSPLYRAFSFAGHNGDSIDTWIRSANGDAVAWLLDDKFNVLVMNDDAPGTTDSHIASKLASNGTFYIVFREYKNRNATFVVTLKGSVVCVCDPSTADCNDNDGDDDDNCIPCTPGKQCVPTNPCHQGAMDCRNGANCEDTGNAVPDGTACGSGLVCTAGQCGAPCPAGKTSCGGQCVDLSSDPKNCGGCGQVCTGTCQGGCVEVLVGSQGGLRGYSMAQDEQNLYIGADEAVFAVDKLTGKSSVLARDTGVKGIATDGTYVYYSSSKWSGSFTMFNGLRRVPCGGGNAVTLAHEDGNPYGAAVYGDFAYLTTNAGSVLMVPKNGGPATVIATEHLGAWSMAADASGVYWIDHNGPAGTVNRAPLGGGPVTTLAVQQDGPIALALDQSNVYWVNEVGAVMQMSKAGGQPIRLAGAGDGGIVDFAAHGIFSDGVNVWWTQAAGGFIVRMPVGGGKATKVFTGQNQPSAIAVDDKAVYWTNLWPSSVLKGAK